MSTMIFVNPGSGPVNDATYEEAEKNIIAFCWDLGPNYQWADREEDELVSFDGRFSFSVFGPNENKEVIVDMPGIPLEEVRYMREEDQNIWNYPRLYVDGDSWVWYFALEQVKYECEDGYEPHSLTDIMRVNEDRNFNSSV